MIKAVIFDMYETLITLLAGEPYFGSQIAADAGIPEKKFLESWRGAEADRTVGKITLEELLEKILRENDCYSENVLREIAVKRMRSREEAFLHLHKEIIPMLNSLKKRGMLIGLVSNCFSEEAVAIRKSILYPYFDAVCLSYEEKLKKPDIEIFNRCLDRLHVSASECLYVGDGGSNELETAQKIGMKAVQAVWYLRDNDPRSLKRKKEFAQLETPMEILERI